MVDACGVQGLPEPEFREFAGFVTIVSGDTNLSPCHNRWGKNALELAQDTIFVVCQRYI